MADNVTTKNPAQPATPGGPAKPPEAAKPPAGGVTRRSFLASLSWLQVGWIAFAAGTGAALTALGRFMFPNVLFEPPQAFNAGLPNEYSLGVDERWKEKYRVWIIRTEEGFFALSGECTHLGCTPNFFASEAKFKCPCHGSGFYASGGKEKIGINFEGPAPRPLERFRIALADDGQIMVDKSRKFQQEKGEWVDPESFLKV